jgi:hypothetical protein
MAEPSTRQILLLDTTYLLPIFGFQIDIEDFELTFSKVLREFLVKYNPIALIEIKWLVLRMIKKNRSKMDSLLSAYRSGLTALGDDKRLSQTPITDSTVEQIADELLERRHVKDYFDRVTYATATRLDSWLLTEDEMLRRIAKAPSDKVNADSNHNDRPSLVITWKELERKLQS